MTPTPSVLSRHPGVTELDELCIGTLRCLAIDAIQKGGTIVAVGVYGDRPRVNMGLVQDRELTLTGTLMYQHRDFVKAVRLMRSGAIVTAPLETTHFPFAEYRAAYDYADREGERSMKIFIDLETT